MMVELRRAALAVALAVALGGCIIGPDYFRPKVDTPASFRYAGSLAGANAAAMSLENSYVNYEDFYLADNDGDGDLDCVSSDPTIVIRLNEALAAAETASIARVGTNDYTVDANISDDNGVWATCGGVDHGTWIDKYIDVTTTITADTRTNFVHLFYGEPGAQHRHRGDPRAPALPYGVGQRHRRPAPRVRGQ